MTRGATLRGGEFLREFAMALVGLECEREQPRLAVAGEAREVRDVLSFVCAVALAHDIGGGACGTRHR